MLTTLSSTAPHQGHLPRGSPRPIIGPRSGARIPAMMIGIPRNAPNPVMQSMTPTMRHIGRMRKPNRRPLKAFLTGAFSRSAGRCESCAGTGTSAPQEGQNRQGDDRCALHFVHVRVMDWSSPRMRTIALQKNAVIGRASQDREQELGNRELAQG